MNRRWMGSYGWLTLGLLAAACGPQGGPVDLEAEERAIRQASLNWSKTERSGAHDWVPDVFWEDAVLQPPGQPQLQGHEEIGAFYAPARLEDSGRPRPRFPLHISASGDLAVEWGADQSPWTSQTARRWSASSSSRSGSAAMESGRFV
jgi:ketosteroid isomerase-like protein